MFDDLAVAVKEVGALEPAGMADEELSEALVEMARLRSALEAAEVQLTASWDSRRVWAGDGAKSGSAWLAPMTREPKRAAATGVTCQPRGAIRPRSE